MKPLLAPGLWLDPRRNERMSEPREKSWDLEAGNEELF
jgi:hypothetical protein